MCNNGIKNYFLKGINTVIHASGGPAVATEPECDSQSMRALYLMSVEIGAMHGHVALLTLMQKSGVLLLHVY